MTVSASMNRFHTSRHGIVEHVVLNGNLSMDFGAECE